MLRNLAPEAVYRADWFDPRTGAYTPIAADLRAPDGRWNIPAKPDGDWALVVKEQS